MATNLARFFPERKASGAGKAAQQYRSTQDSTPLTIDRRAQGAPSNWRAPILGMLSLWGAFCGSALAQEGLANGGLHPGTLAADETNSYTFTATAGENVVLRAGRVTGSIFFSPWLRIFSPDGTLVGTMDAVNNAVSEVALTATNSGTFAVMVSDGSYGGYSTAGTYDLSYFKSSSSFEVFAGDEGGDLINGVLHEGIISDGDLDVWSFAANSGANVVVRVGEVTASGFFNPSLRLYGPDGALVGSADPNNSAASEVTLTTTNSGTFTVVVADGNYGSLDGTGDYLLSLALAPGEISVASEDEGGALINGALNHARISEGDLDVWSFTAASGDSVVVRAGEVTSTGFFNPWLRVYGPDGTLMGSADPNNSAASEVTLTTTNSGTFTVVVADGNYGSLDGTGDYLLSLALAPGDISVSPEDEGGALINGALNHARISEGDLDVWSFAATSGDSVVVRVGEVTSTGFFNPWVRVYGPDGGLLGSDDPGTYGAAEVALTVTNSGAFTAVVADGGYGSLAGTGDYELSFVRVPGDIVVSPGDEGGALTNGVLIETTISPGDLDAWNFEANAGESVVLRFGGVTSTGYFNPWLRLYGPSGALVASQDTGTGVAAEIALTATNTGTFTAVVSDGPYSGYAGTGTYGLTLAHAPSAVFVSPGDEGGAMKNGITYTGANTIGDLEVWSFYGTPGDSNVFRIATTNFTPWLRLYDPAGALAAQAFTASTANRTNHLVYVVTNAGNYTLVSGSYYVTQSGGYGLKQSRVPPDLNVPETQMLSETEALNVMISAQDPDEPDKPLAFELVSGPPGLTLTSAGNTNAMLSWMTTEADGPGTHLVTVSVTDIVNGTAFTRTNSFTVIINELNEPPTLTVPDAQVVDEMTPLIVSASAGDVDIPANSLTFNLVSPPAGMAINPNTGAISWTPSEAQGSNTYTIDVAVTDTNPTAVNATRLSVTNSFTVVVHEINTTPQLILPGNQTLTELSPLNVMASATDTDDPPNTFTYGLVSGPAGMTIDSNTGAIGWTPTEAQGSNIYSVTVSVTDNNPLAVNAQHLSMTNSFSLTVNESNTPPRFTSVPGSQTITEQTTLNVSVVAVDDDLPANPLTYALLSPPPGMNIHSGSGAITWTPTEAQGSNTYTITITVADTNAAAFNSKQFFVTNSFMVTVNESNRPPVLEAITNPSVHYGTPLSVQAVASDPDLPANALEFALIQSPTGMVANPTSGLVTWIPALTQVGTFPVTLRVSDNGIPSLSATQTFEVTVTGQPTRLAINPLGNLVQINIHGDIGLDYELQYSTNLVNWDRLLRFKLDTSPYPHVDPESAVAPRRYYRLILAQ